MPVSFCFPSVVSLIRLRFRWVRGSETGLAPPNGILRVLTCFPNRPLSADAAFFLLTFQVAGAPPFRLAGALLSLRGNRSGHYVFGVEIVAIDRPG